ncbi:hypothetical protein INT45_010302 [Circinella minor]|uniref:INO80 complex subunit E N-terminal domain-containing protein n=1 Tax=Circinella minor TaxID=1195481 RepID=A0A8H7S9R5_9FUNG|nr:hypothetical protein INT45_010302 [Circinella minor]
MIDKSITEEKYKQLKRKLKVMMEVNESISKEYSQAKRKVRLLMMERNVLLDNIAQMGTVEIETSSSDEYEEDDDFINELLLPMTTKTTSFRQRNHHQGEKMYHSHDQSRQLTADHNNKLKPLSRQRSTSEEKQHISLKQRQRRRRRKIPKNEDEDTNQQQQQQQQQNVSILNSTVTASAPPKRSKMSRTVIKTRRVQPVERDENGNIKLPQQIGVLTVVNLGKIIYDREAFHNERYIFPVGFTVERTYPSMINPHSNTSIVSTILDGGDGPRFHIVAADMPDQPIIANSATGAWTVVVRRSNEIRQREHSNSASGPDYYGFKHPTIAKMIQDLPNAYKLRHYVRQNFEEMEPRAAKGVMAAAKKKRGNLEQMGNANVRPQNNNMRPPDDDMEEVDMEDVNNNNSFIKPFSSSSSTSTTTPLPSPPSHSTSLSFITSAVSQHNQHRYQQQQQQQNQNQEKTTNDNKSSVQQKNHSYNNPHSISNLLQPISPSPFKVMNGFEHKYNDNDNNDDDQVDQLHSDNDNEIF